LGVVGRRPHLYMTGYSPAANSAAWELVVQLMGEPHFGPALGMIALRIVHG